MHEAPLDKQVESALHLSLLLQRRWYRFAPAGISVVRG
jgi:hypothetical protein